MDIRSLTVRRTGKANDSTLSAYRHGEMLDNSAREWLGLRELSVYANICERTLRSWIHAPHGPLPAVKVRGNVLVRKADFDKYLEHHRVQPLAGLNVDRILEDVVGKGR